MLFHTSRRSRTWVHSVGVTPTHPHTLKLEGLDRDQLLHLPDTHLVTSATLVRLYMYCLCGKV